MTVDTTPVGFYPDGHPMYADTEVDARFYALLYRYRFTPGERGSERMAVADAFSAVVAPENLAHADRVVEALRALTGPDAPLFKDLLQRYDNTGPNPDRKIIAAGLRAVAAHPTQVQEAVAVLEAMVDLAKRRAARLAAEGIGL